MSKSSARNAFMASSALKAMTTWCPSEASIFPMESQTKLSSSTTRIRRPRFSAFAIGERLSPPDRDSTLFRQSLSQRRFERFTSKVLSDYRAGAIQKECGRDALNPIFGRQFVTPAFAIVILRPCHLHLLCKVLQFLLVLIQADSDDFEPLGVMFVVSPNYIWQLLDTGTAPGCPEIHQHNFAFVIGHG